MISSGLLAAGGPSVGGPLAEVLPADSPSSAVGTPGGGPEAVQHSLHDNQVLDDFTIPFGEWVDQAVDWLTVNLKWLFNIIEWPFNQLNSFFVDTVLRSASWLAVIAAFFVLGSVVRNVRVGLFAAAGLTVCGLLGSDYWQETVRTIGFIGVAVVLCVVIGIPTGIACGLLDSAWRAVRPVLDAMQVVHSFVYMLPVIYFFGIGEVSATMVTMVFAIPPLIRLTNLGIRQVPEDVVEASRAYGASEWRVLLDVQMPLARPAIMTGVNQTLLLAISMLGIAAIMGAGGLGRLLFNALQQQSVSLGSASGLAFFLVAVVLDRISQSEPGDRGGLLKRIRLAWSHRRDPEKLLGIAAPISQTRPGEAPGDRRSDLADAAPGDRRSKKAGTAAADRAHGGGADAGSAHTGTVEAAQAGIPSGAGHSAAIAQRERPWMLVTLIGGGLAVVSVLLTWHADAGFMSAHGRRADEGLLNQSSSGLSASGGSWYGILCLILGSTVLAATSAEWRAPGRGRRVLNAGGAAVGSLALLVVMAAYAAAALTPNPLASRVGAGVYTALSGGVVASIGSAMWVRAAPYSPRRPLKARVSAGPLIGGAAAVVVVLIGMLSAWSFDQRDDGAVGSDRRAELDEIDRRVAELRQQSREQPQNAPAIATELVSLLAKKNIKSLVITDGISRAGPRLGLWALIAGLAGFAAAVPTAGVACRGERGRWHWSVAAAGMGAGVSAVALGWILVHVRSADPGYVSGVGAFLTLVGGFLLVTAAAGPLKEFRRAEARDATS